MLYAKSESYFYVETILTNAPIDHRGNYDIPTIRLTGERSSSELPVNKIGHRGIKPRLFLVQSEMPYH